MLDYNQLKPGTYIILDGQRYVVTEFKFVRMQQRRPVAQTKIKNLITGNVIEKTFQQSDKIEEAELETRPVKYLYAHRGEAWFCPEKNPADRFKLSESQVGDYVDMMKPNSTVDAIVFSAPGGDQIIKIKIPIKVELKVVEAPPSTKGNTAQGGTKQVKLESGAVINVPLFIDEGDIVRINTETRGYIERVEKNK